MRFFPSADKLCLKIFRSSYSYLQKPALLHLEKRGVLQDCRSENSGPFLELYKIAKFESNGFSIEVGSGVGFLKLYFVS